MINKKDYSKISAENADEICATIRNNSEEEAGRVLEVAAREEERLLSEASAEARKRKEAILVKAGKDIEKIRENIFSTENMEKKRIILSEKNKFIEDVIAAVKKEAYLFRQDKGYPEFLKKAILEGLNVINDANVEIIYSSLDNNIIGGALKKEIEDLARANVRKDISIDFKDVNFNDIGVMVQSKDGRMFFDNRFSARFKRAYEDIYMRLLKEAF